MVQQKRSDDSEAIGQTAEQPTPSHQGSSGGNMAREVGERNELKTAGGGDPLPTSVDARDKPEDGDLPTRPRTRK